MANQAECLRCGHGVVWHPPPADIPVVSDCDPANLLAATDSTGCAASCYICDLIVNVIEIDERGRAL